MNGKPFWNPYIAGIALGLVLLASFVVTGKGLGGSGAFNHANAAVFHATSLKWAEENRDIKDYFSPQRGPLNSWIVFLALGVAIGGGVGAWSAQRVKAETVRGPCIERDVRWLLAFAGGALSGVAAQIARGCTGGQALTGGAQLAPGSWIFMFAMFGSAYALA